MSDKPFNPEGDFIASRIVPRRFEYPWWRIKEELIREVSLKIIPPMIDSGKYHVLKLEMGRRPTYEHYEEATEYFIVARLSLAREEKIRVIPVFPELSVQFIDELKHEVKVDRVCLHCGNKLNFDARGGCVACGAPNGGYK